MAGKKNLAHRKKARQDSAKAREEAAKKAKEEKK